MKKRLTSLIALFFLLVACGPAAESIVTEPAAVVPSADEPPVIAAVAADDATAEPEPPMAVATSVPPVVSEPDTPFSPAKSEAEAAIIRSQDHVIGAEEPVVAIIEYGDYQ